MTGDVRVEVFDDAEAMARAAATFVVERATAAEMAQGRFTFAVSGGHTPWAMFRYLEPGTSMPWLVTELFQVDERVAPSGDPDRNLTHLAESLSSEALQDVTVHPMPVVDEDLEGAAARYAAELPESFDLIHLGLGPDGHTASLVPGDPVLDVTDRDVAVTQEYAGRRRMTLTYPVLDRARQVLWLVAGPDKADALARLRAGDGSVPAGRVRTSEQVIFADRAAVG
ncbi:MAG: 6-phosphogluconolactonase [Actinomycetota bacterium]